MTSIQLKKEGKLNKYEELLKVAHDPLNLENVMCRNLISVDWRGFLYDCDFNQQLGINLKGDFNHIKDLIQNKKEFIGNPISVNNHCFGCTAGNGSSCSGALNKLV